MLALAFTYFIFHIHYHFPHYTIPNTQLNTIHAHILLSTHLHTDQLAGLKPLSSAVGISVVLTMLPLFIPPYGGSCLIGHGMHRAIELLIDSTYKVHSSYID